MRKKRHITGSLAQAGVLSRVTLRRNLEVQLPSEPYRYPRLPQAAKTLSASGRQYKQDNETRKMNDNKIKKENGKEKNS